MDGPGFGAHSHPDRIVQADPCDGTAAAGTRYFQSTVRVFVAPARDTHRHIKLD